MSSMVDEFWKSVNIWRIMGKSSASYFLTHGVDSLSQFHTFTFIFKWKKHIFIADSFIQFLSRVGILTARYCFSIYVCLSVCPSRYG